VTAAESAERRTKSPRRIQPTRRAPKLRHHKASGQGFVQMAGRFIYLGRYDDPATHQRYHQLIAEYLAGKPVVDDAEATTVAEVLAGYLEHARRYYRDARGRLTPEVHHVCSAARIVRQLYGRERASDFGPLALKACRQQMVEKGWCRRHVNQQTQRIKRIFRWAAENELVGGEVYHALQAVAGLRRGRTAARESSKVTPVPPERIEAVKPYVSRQVWAMIQLQLATAARPGEIVRLRPCDVDRSGRVWFYTPAEHKTAYRGQERVIYLGPRAQRVLSPFLLRPGDRPCFSPAEADAERRQAAHQQRATPLSCGNTPGSNRRRRPRKAPGEAYTVASYRRAICEALKKAYPPPGYLARRDDELVKEYRARLTDDERGAIKAWHAEHHWHPHQLRHNAATELRKEFGLETARVILGHRSPAVTTIYAEQDQQKALEAMERVG